MATTRATPASVVALRFDGAALWAIDQTELPWRERELELRSAEDVAAAIRRLAIRGAPLIGVAAAYGVVARARARPLARRARARLRAPPRRPPHRGQPVVGGRPGPRGRPRSTPADPHTAAALDEARAIEAEEESASDAIAAHGADLLAGARRILTHCNTGALAAPGRGTALAVIAELAAARHARARARHRIAPAPPGRAPDRVRARPPEHPSRADRRQRRRRADRRAARSTP